MTNTNLLSTQTDDQLIFDIYCRRHEFADNEETEIYFQEVEEELKKRGYTPSLAIQPSEWHRILIKRKSNDELVAMLKYGGLKKLVKEEISSRHISKERVKAIKIKLLEQEEIEDMITLNGFGTTLYGHVDNNHSDGSYVSTMWFTLFFLPIIPLKSFRVFSHSGFLIRREYRLRRAPLNIKQVLITYLVAYGLLAILWYIIERIGEIS